MAVWTNDRVAKLRALWSEGLSAREIALRLGGFGHTGDGGRSAVIGKASRLGLVPHRTVVALNAHRLPRKSQRVSGGPQKKPSRPPRMSAPGDVHGATVVQIATWAGVRSPRNATPGGHPARPRHLTVLDLEPGDCRYPYGEQSYTFCGNPAVAGISYCEDHAKICFAPPKVDRSPPNLTAGNETQRPATHAANSVENHATGQLREKEEA